jgi:PAS domain S-box-containing protein
MSTLLSHNGLSGRWFSAAELRAVEDFWQIYQARAPRSPRPAARRRTISAEPEAARTLLGRAIDDGEWDAYEVALKRHARRCAEVGIPFEALELGYGRLIPEVAPDLLAAYSGVPKRLIAALDVVGRIVLRELAILGAEYLAAREDARTDRGPRAQPMGLDTVGDGVIATDQLGVITQINATAQQLVGWTADEAVGRPLDEVFRLVDVDSGDRVPSRVDEVLSLGKTVGAPRPPSLVARDGSTPCAIADSITPIHDDDGTVRGAILVFRDQNRERAHGEALEASEARTSAIIESSLDGVITTDEDGIIAEFNGAAEQMFGYSRDDVTGRRFADLLLPADGRSAWAEAIAEDVRTGGREVIGKRREMMALRAGGVEFPVELAVVWIPAASGETFTCFVRDLTEARRAREALTRSQAQLRALAGRVQAAREEERTRIARELHDELGQQLTAIRMDLGWLVRRQEHATPAVRERLEAMTQLVDTTFKMVRRLGTELRPGILDDLGLAAAIEWQAREFESRSGIEVAVDASAELRCLDAQLATAIFRIFQEILTNVGRHAGARHVTARLVERDGRVVFEVADDGRGIRPEEAANVDSLGLLGMRERAALLAGTFRIEARPEGGTLVTVELPCHTASS